MHGTGHTVIDLAQNSQALRDFERAECDLRVATGAHAAADRLLELQAVCAAAEQRVTSLRRRAG